VDKIREAGGEIYAITSEPQRLATMATEAWELSFESVGDPHHEISASCRQRGWLELFVNDKTSNLLGGEDSIYSHPKGYFQPGVLALDPSSRILYRWRGRPTRKNMGGATERPTAAHVFENVSRALSSSSSTGEAADAALDTKPKLDSRGLPWPIFMSLLIANGWFIKPKPFPFIQHGPTVTQRARNAMTRIPFFIALWVMAFVMFPALGVATAMLVYGAWLTPFIGNINSQFQNEPEATIVARAP